jgi:hypothetical protein
VKVIIDCCDQQTFFQGDTSIMLGGNVHLMLLG